MPYRNDWIFLGLLSGVIGSLLWLSGVIIRPDPAGASSILGSKSVLIKAAAIQRREQLFAAGWFLLAFVLTGTGTLQRLRAKGAPRSEWLVRRSGTLLVLVVIGAVGFTGSWGLARRLARREYEPRLVAIQREPFAAAAFRLRHEGLEPAEVEGRSPRPPGHVLAERLEAARRYLHMAGRLFDMPRRRGESDLDYLDRLQILFARHAP